MEHSKLRPFGFGKRNSGIALILVLMLVVLITIMILAFFLSTQTETKSMRSVVSGQNSRQLADIAVQSVISQIQLATTQGPTVAWASQPGMIRTYNNSGTVLNWYKLYSATNTVIKPGSETLAQITQDLPTAGFATPGSANYGVYTDINSPVYSADGTLTYPIVNPSGSETIAQAAGKTPVSGFYIANSTSTTPWYVPGATAGSNASPTNNPAAMPVLWTYILRDGTQVPAQGAISPGVVSVPGASSSNPIVGRIAYWTDDETCKVNVNTAGDGTYFDTPRFGSAAEVQYTSTESGPQRDIDRIVDKQLAMAPPIAGEYQRYAGHPAQTRLSYVLPNILSNTSLGLGDHSNIFSQITPFMQWGGSEAGAYTFLDSVPALFPPQRQTPYATLDEWMFNTQLNTASPPTRLSNTDLSGNPIVTSTGSSTSASLQQLRFFLSANSDAPEVNLFGQPRIAIWPINSNLNLVSSFNSPYATTLDKMIANASSLLPTNGGTSTQNAYYFARSNSESKTYDYSSIPRNQSIYQYLRALSNTSIPGFGNTFDGKYKIGEMDQILTEIFDYIRSTNPSDPLLPVANQYAQTEPRNVTAPFGSGNGAETAGGGQVVPIFIKPGSAAYTTKGFGRFFSISDITFDFTQSQASIGGEPIITCLASVGLYSPSLGPANMIPDIRVEIDGLNALTLTTTSGTTTSAPQAIFGPVTSNGDTARSVYSVIPEITAANVNNSYDWHDGNGVGTSALYDFQWGGPAGSRLLMFGHKASYQDLTSVTGTPVGNTGNYMFCGYPIAIPAGSTLNFSGGTLTVKISWADFNYSPGKDPAFTKVNGDGYPGTATDLVQTITVPFPAFSAPAPTNTPDSAGMTDRLGYLIYGPTSGPARWMFLDNDTTRSLIAGYNGDARLIAAQTSFTGTGNSETDTTQPFVYFDPGSTVQSAQTQRDIFPDSNFITHAFLSPGSLLKAVTYASPTFNGYISDHTSSASPDVSGDWDNGPGAFPDGPYINKADESDYQYANFGPNTPYPYYGGGSGSSGTAIAYSSPNRIVASPVTFGSLPTGVPMPTASPAIPAVPWRTLLFRPQPTHFGATSPEDELLLDWFWMPVVDPYAISTTFATSGKVNMNYQIAPFTYITRASALMGVLGSEYVIAVPTLPGTSNTYKTRTTNPNPAGTTALAYRQSVKVLADDGVSLGDDDGTFRQFKDLFNNGEIFKSAAQICDIYLEPLYDPSTGNLTTWGKAGTAVGVGTSDATYTAAATTFWQNNALAGDNSRERPYNGLYSRLTTKSNTYTVHVRAQSLAAPINATAGQWVENPQAILSEYRGSVTINRYLDPQDPNIPDFVSTIGTSGPSKSIDSYYKYRVLETRRFLP